MHRAGTGWRVTGSALAVVVSVGILIKKIFGYLIDLIAGLHFLQDRVRHHLLLDQILQLHRGHLQHLDTLAQLGRQYHLLLECCG